MLKFNLEFLKPGHILHVRGYLFVSRSIRKVLSIRAKREGLKECWGNHDAPVVMYRDSLYVGDHTFPYARLTSLRAYEDKMNLPADDKRRIEVMVLDVKGISDVGRRTAANYWIHYKLGKFYDIRAFPRLLIKNACLDIFDSDPGWEWADWCTQGTADSYNFGAHIDAWKKPYPTPYTTEKRLDDTIEDVSDQAIIEI